MSNLDPHTHRSGCMKTARQERHNVKHVPRGHLRESSFNPSVLFDRSRCRLDRASSPPPALKFVAAAATEVREALVGFTELLEVEAEEERHAVNGCDPCHAALERQSQLNINRLKTTATAEILSATEVLTTIVSKCRFLLKSSSCLPAVSLVR